MLRRCLVLSGAFALAIACGLGFALESRAAKIDVLERPARETSRDLLLGLARFDLGRDDNWRRTSRDDDDDRSRNDNRSVGSRDDDDGNKGKSRDEDDDNKSWDVDDDGKSRNDDDDDDGKSRDDDDDGKSRDDDDGKPSHKDDDDGKPKSHDDGGYHDPIPEPRAVLAFLVGGLVVGWATRRSRR